MSYTFTNFVYTVKLDSTVNPSSLTPFELVLVNPNTGAHLNRYGGVNNDYLHRGTNLIAGPDGQFYNHTNLILDFRELDLSNWPYTEAQFSPGANLRFSGGTNNLLGNGIPGYYTTAHHGGTTTFEMDRISLILPDGWTYNARLFQDSSAINASNVAEEDTLTSVNSYIGLTDPNGKYIWISTPHLNMAGQTVVIPPCFTRGSRILCADGAERAVEDLSIGDEILTKDNGLQPIRWIGSSRLDADTLSAFPNRRPVRIRAGAVGNARDLSVSPQHRMLVTGDLARAVAPGQDEVLVPAKALLNDHSITTDHAAREVEYFHILFDRHELIRAEGAWSESFLPGSYMMDAMDRDTVNEIVSILPELENGTHTYSPPARPLAKAGKATIAIRKLNAVRDQN